MHISQSELRRQKPLERGLIPRRRKPKKPAAEPSFSVLLDDWLATVRPRLKETTFAVYSTIVECHLRPTFGERGISAITENDVNDFLNAMSTPPDGLSASTVKGIATVLRAVLAHGALYGCRVDPGACRCTARIGKTEVCIFSDSEQAQIVSVCGKNPSCKNLGILICLQTGLRLGEICALKWGDISEETGVLTIRRTLSRIRSADGGAATQLHFGEPKSQCSRRTIPLSPQLWEILRQRRLEDDCFVLSGSADKPVEPRSMQRHFKTVLRSIGVADRNFHALRHTFATKCVERGFDVKSLSLILGHSDVSITLNTYVHPSKLALSSVFSGAFYGANPQF